MSIRIGIIGVRGMGSVRAEAICQRKDCELTGIAGRDVELLRESAERWDCSYTLDWRELVQRPDIDAIIVSTPNATHYPMGMAALKAGKHVFMEYPLAISLHECDDLIETARAGKLVLSCGQSGRYEGPHLAITELLPKIGPVLSAYCSIELPEVWNWAARDEVMGDYFALANFHMVDHLIDWLGPVSWVNASLDAVKDEAGNNTRLMGCQQLGFRSGANAFVQYGMGIVGPHADFTEFLQGEDGYIRLEGDVSCHYREDGEIRSIQQTTDSLPSVADSQKRDIGEFLNAVHHGAIPPLNGDVIRHPCEVAFASTLSARQGKRVDLPLAGS